MDVKPLCIVQARYHSHRLPGKMLMTLGGETLIARGYRIACEAFGKENVIVAIPMSDTISPLADELDRIGARMMAWDGDESDVLGRFHHVAHRFRWSPDSVIVRYTPDDPFKTVDGLRRVAAGERLPVEIGGEAFTLAQLDAARERWRHAGDITAHPSSLAYEMASNREHISYALFDTPAPPAPPGIWSIDTRDDYLAALARIEEIADGFERASWDLERGAIA